MAKTRTIVIMLVTLSLFSFNFSPVIAGTLPLNQVQVGTSLTPDATGGQAPIVKAKWEANPDRWSDDDLAWAGPQFTASGIYNGHKAITICAIATDPDGVADVINVYADVFYPEDIALGPSHVALPNQSGLGCGQLMQEDSLSVLTKSDGYNLFCNQVRNGNNSLPTFLSGYNYDEICKADGELMKETAKVYCGAKTISYEDPEGSYTVWAVAQDKVGLQGILENSFDYLATTAFETDFKAIGYGNVKLNTEKLVSGDLQFGTGLASIRNTGNTRAEIGILQDDMGFGKTSGNWNVSYKARIGSGEADWVIYGPTALIDVVPTALKKQLDLSEYNEMDFGITVYKFPPTHADANYSGTIILSAQYVTHLSCEVKG